MDEALEELPTVMSYGHAGTNRLDFDPWSQTPTGIWWMDGVQPSDDRVQHVSLRPGLNVVYGKNGSGKTRLLRRIIRCAEGASAAHNRGTTPTQSLLFEPRREIFDSHLDSTVAPRVQDAPHLTEPSLTVARPMLTSNANRTVKLTGENLAILREFQALGELTWVRPLNASDRKCLVAVPICLPGSRGPVTQAVIDRYNAWLLRSRPLTGYIETVYELEYRLRAWGERDGGYTVTDEASDLIGLLRDCAEISITIGYLKDVPRTADTDLGRARLLSEGFASFDQEQIDELAFENYGLDVVPYPKELFQVMFDGAESDVRAFAKNCAEEFEREISHSIIFNSRNFMWRLNDEYVDDQVGLMMSIFDGSAVGAGSAQELHREMAVRLPALAVHYLEEDPVYRQTQGWRSTGNVDIDQVRVRHLDVPEDVPVSIVDDVDNLVRQVASKELAEHNRRNMDAVRTGNPEVVLEGFEFPDFQSRIATANAILGRLLPTAPLIRVVVGDPHSWLTGTAPQVRLGREGLAAASSTQLRWVHLALRIAFTRAEDQAETGPLAGLGFRDAADSLASVPALIVIDEPERGLHRAAESAIARTLDELASENGSVVVAASHSPDFLNRVGANLIHVDRQKGTRGWRESDFADLEALGLRKADSFALTNLFLVVEGPHDEAVLKALFGEQLAALQVRVYPLHGARHTPKSLESGIIFDQSDAKMMLLLDNVSGNHIASVWEEARELARLGKSAESRDILLREIDKNTAEGKWIQDFGIKALAEGQAERVELFGLSEPDIIFYLPASAFTNCDNWSEVITTFRKESRKPDQYPKKKWIGDKYGTDTASPEAFTEAALDIVFPHQDLQDMMARIAATVRTRQPGE